MLRRTVRRIGLLDRTRVFDEDAELHARIEGIAERLAANPLQLGPPRDELLERLRAQ